MKHQILALSFFLIACGSSNDGDDGNTSTLGGTSDGAGGRFQFRIFSFERFELLAQFELLCGNDVVAK